MKDVRHDQVEVMKIRWVDFTGAQMTDMDTKISSRIDSPRIGRVADVIAMGAGRID